MPGRAVSVTTYLKMDIEKIAKDYEEGLLESEAVVAKELAVRAEANFKRKTKHTGSGETEQGFFDFKSFYKNGGWVAGVFDEKKSNWEDSVGGRAHFFEYGRSPAGQARSPVWTRRAFGQPPRPFIRPAMNTMSRKYGGITRKKLQRLARKLNRRNVSIRSVVNTANRIA